MGELNLEESEKRAIRVIDAAELSRLIDQAIAEGRTSALRGLPINDCGPYLGSKLYELERVLSEFTRAKSAKKREETRYLVDRAGRDLSFAFARLIERLGVATRTECSSTRLHMCPK